MDGAITDVSGMRVGHFSHFEALTGSTVILCESGALALGEKEADTNTVGVLAEVALIHAIMRSVQRADGLGAILAFKDISK